MLALPPGSCDCHTHVFLDEPTYPFWPGRRYTPPPAPLAALTALHAAVGIERVVIVQPSVYGLDNSATLDALRTLGTARARGVAVIDERTDDAVLDQMARAGVRGVRVNLEVDAERDAGRAAASIQQTAERVAHWHWHVQIYASLPLLAACSSLLRSLPVPLVFDHHAGAQASQGVDQAGIAQVVELVASGKAYVKLSAPYRSSTQAGYRDLEPLTHLLVRANPDRMLWGSDWPHPQPGVQADPLQVSPPHQVDLARVLDSTRAWIDDDTALHKLFVDNPQRLYFSD